MDTSRILFHRLAQAEYDKAYDWYARRSIESARRFDSEVDLAVQRIAGNPERWPVFRGEYRWVRTRRFPYVLFYRRVDSERVLVMAVAHGRRKPGYWLRRWGRP